uniref:DNA polymerase epsilon subunit 3 n=2 Tax=Meloidogyne incognita group TaxID=654580 RepID=A0A914LMS3_MELIC
MEVTSDDLKFPKAIVARIIKDALPENAIVSNEAKNAIARSAAIFILHATSLANDNAHSKKRKNVTAEDVLYAVRQLECSELESPVVPTSEFHIFVQLMPHLFVFIHMYFIGDTTWAQ